jgi:primosomal protein N' (replication factor Y)
VQTFEPNHPVIQLAAAHDYTRFANEELTHRARAGLPPIARMARIVVRDEQIDKATAEAEQLTRTLRQAAEAHGIEARIVGPLPAPIARIGGYFRMQIEIKADAATVIQQLLTAVRDAGLLHSDATTAVDVDPISLL